MRITGVLSGLNPVSNVLFCTEGEKIYPKSVGKIISNPDISQTTEQIFANSWIYNTSSRFYVKDISLPVFTLLSTDVDKSSLKINDTVEILERDTQTILFSGATVNSLGLSNNNVTVTLDNLIGFNVDSNKKYDIRRKLNKAVSTGAELEYGNNVLTSDIQNLYTDRSGNFYVASNSLPSYSIDAQVIKYSITQAIKNSTLQDYNEEKDLYSTISFSTPINFNSGDEVYYTFSNKPLSGLFEGKYFVKVLPTGNQIKLYSSSSFLDTNNYLEFTVPENNTSGSHSFTLYSQRTEKIGAQKLLRKFPPVSNNKNGFGEETEPGSVGMLINGVEIINYKSQDKVYYGPLEKAFIVNSGKNYNVIDPPSITV
jgi:hypothetical protein